MRRKATRTVRDDRTDIMPDHVIDVCKSIIINLSLINYTITIIYAGNT